MYNNIVKVRPHQEHNTMSLTGHKGTLDSESKAYNYYSNLALLNKLFYIIQYIFSWNFFVETAHWKRIFNEVTLTVKAFID